MSVMPVTHDQETFTRNVYQKLAFAFYSVLQPTIRIQIIALSTPRQLGLGLGTGLEICLHGLAFLHRPINPGFIQSPTICYCRLPYYVPVPHNFILITHASVQVSGTSFCSVCHPHYVGDTRCRNLNLYQNRVLIRCKFLVSETFKHSRPIKPHSFGHVHRCKFLEQVPSTIIFS